MDDSMSAYSPITQTTGARAAAHTVTLLVALLGCGVGVPAEAHIGVGPAHCTPLPGAQTWLDRHIALWDPVLSQERGYQRPDRVTVCVLEGSLPFADNRTNRVYVRGLDSTNDQITLAHEYVHIAFQHFPSGHDERYVERTARRLIATHP